MRLKLVGYFLILLLLQGCMSAATSSASAIYNRYNLQSSIGNKILAWQVQEKINSDSQLKYEAHVVATAFSQVILLTGETPTAAMRRQAEHYALTTPHVKRVVNRLAIAAPVSTTQQLKDSWITTKINTQIIADGQMDPDNIKVVTENNIVYLLGVLLRPQAKQAIEIARNTDGVTKVITVLYYLDPTTQ